MPSHPDRSPWYRSFYWRIGVSFLVLVVGVIVVQSVMFSQLMRRSAPPVSPPHVRAAAIAAELGARLADNAGHDVDELLRRDHGSDRQRIYFVTKSGAVAGNTQEPLAAETKLAALAMLGNEAAIAAGREAVGRSRSPGPVVTAPVQVSGELRGMVVLPPPPIGGVSRDVGRLLSLPGTLVLLAATVLATLVIFRPARRRLTALEDAAARLGGGDLSVRAADAGNDEIARVARAFNRMAGDLAARDEALRRSARLRRQMLADVSHELRTPLTTMRGYLETLRMPEVVADAATRERYLEIVERETRRLERIVADLLDLARLEGGGGTLQARVFALERLFAGVVRRHEREITGRRLVAQVRVEEGADQVTGDPDRLEQVTENLFANALRHTPDGGVIELRAAAISGGVRLSVTDSGPGISADHLPHIFERFYKVDSGRAAGGGGSGLGLSIVKAIVERHGGAIDVTSTPGRTEFAVTLPQAESVSP